MRTSDGRWAPELYRWTRLCHHPSHSVSWFSIAFIPRIHNVNECVYTLTICGDVHFIFSKFSADLFELQNNASNTIDPNRTSFGEHASDDGYYQPKYFVTNIRSFWTFKTVLRNMIRKKEGFSFCSSRCSSSISSSMYFCVDRVNRFDRFVVRQFLDVVSIFVRLSSR